MEDTKKCLIIGLPGAGKSTYIGAFWAIEKDGDSGHKLTCIKYPENTVYLDALKKNWLEQTIVQRTVNEIPQEIRLTLLSSLRNENLELHIPDFKGEIFQRILTNNISEKVKVWCDSSDCILYFIKNLSADTLQDEMPAADSNKANSKGIEPQPMKIEDVSEWTQNIMLLKYLREQMGGDIPIAICVSAWDQIVTTKSIDQWMKINHLFFYNFVSRHFTDFKFFGISAQGLEYKDEKFDEYQQRTELKQRAYIYTDCKDFDITEPFNYLISQ